MNASVDLGQLGGLATALGLVDGAGNFRGDWLSAPGKYLSSVLADSTQRDALISFVDDVLGGEARETDAHGLVWVPIVTHTNPVMTVYVVLDAAATDSVGVGVGLRLSTVGPESKTRLHLPLFRAPKTGHTVASPLLIGTVNAFVRLDTEIALGGPPLGGIGLSLRVPTAEGATPEVALTLRALRLPGSTAARDVALSLDSTGALEDAVLQLVLGLARAQADALGPGALASLIGLLGLSGGAAVPPLPLDRLSTEGTKALGDWFASVMSDGVARTAWLGSLASLLGGAPSGDAVTLTIGAAQVSFRVAVDGGIGGHPMLTPLLSVTVAPSADVRIRADVELCRADLASRSVLALPRLDAFLQIGKRADGGAQLMAGDPRVDGFRSGFSLNGARRPTFLLAADGVTINHHEYATIDLTSPSALAEVGATALSGVLDQLLSRLGPIATVIRPLLGLAAPASAPGLSLASVAAFLQDPLAAIRAYWRALVRDHPEALPELLDLVRTFIADASRAAAAITGQGTESDRWIVPIISLVQLEVWRSGNGDALEVALSGQLVTDTLGQRCTRVQTRVTMGLARLDLAAGAVTFLTSLEGRLTARARGQPQSRFDLGLVVMTADAIGLAVHWRPTAGLTAEIMAPNLATTVDGLEVPVTLPVFAADGSVALDADGWDALERLVSVLATIAPLPYIAELATTLGWTVDPRVELPRLRLADLVTDATAAVKAWLTALLISEEGHIRELLNALARVISGSHGIFGQLDGTGRRDDPYRVPLLPLTRAPELVVWLTPDGPDLPFTAAPDPLRRWRPGARGLRPTDLADGLWREGAVGVDVRAFVSGREALTDGLAALVQRWLGTDGRIAPPPTAPSGVTVHQVANVSRTGLPRVLPLAEWLGTAPATVVHVAIAGASEPSPWPGAPADRVIDLRAPALAPDAFPAPAAASGEWFVTLASRADARLASGDSDGTTGQSARLAHVLAPFQALPGGVVLAAREGAGHAAVGAATALTFVTGVVTVGTAWGPVAFNVLDEPPAADALRLLRAVLPAEDPAEPDDPVLALGRDLVGSLTSLLPLDDPGRDVRPPTTPPALRAGLSVHAAFGVLDEETVRAALTAIVAAGLSQRAMARAAVGRRRVAGARAALRLPVAPGTSGVTVSGHAVLDLIGVESGDSGVSLTTSRGLAVHLEIRRANGWLVGGPDPGRGPGPRSTQEVRWVEANIRVPLDGGESDAELVLHEPHVFGIVRDRWVVRGSGAATAASGVVTPALPEVRVLLSQALEQLAVSAPTSPQLTALLDLLRGFGLVGAPGGLVPDALDHLLFDTAAHVTTALADGGLRASISAALTQFLNGLPVTLDLAQRRIVLDADATPGALGMLAWSAHVELPTAGPVSAQVSVGDVGITAAGGAVLRAETGPFRVALDWHRAGATESLELWPSLDGGKLGRLLALAPAAECARIALEYLRSLDEAARPVLDTAYDALGLLAPPSPDGSRAVVFPLGLLAAPVDWFRHASALGGGAGVAPSRVIQLLDALKQIVGVAGNTGEWNLATGVIAFADSSDGSARLGLRVDTSTLAPIAAAAGRLTIAGTFHLTIPPGVAPRPGVELSVGLAGAAPGRRAVHVAIDPALRVFMRPETGADIPLYPDPPGLGTLASVATAQALPLVLDALAAQTGPSLAGRVGPLVAALGDALALRTGAPPSFDGPRLQVWAADPAGSLVAALPSLTAAALQTVATAVQPLLAGAATATVVDGELRVAVNSFTWGWRPAPFQISCSGTATGIVGIERVAVQVAFDQAGLHTLSMRVGPSAINARAATLRPFVAVTAGASPAGGRRVELGLALDNAAARTVFARWNLAASGFTLTATDGATELTDPQRVVLALLDAVLDLVAGAAIATTALQQLLSRAVGDRTVREALRGVVLADVPGPTALDTELFAPDRFLPRLKRLAVNLAAAHPSAAIGDGLTLGLSSSGSIVQVTLGITGRHPVSPGDVTVSIEADSRWIKGQPAPGLRLGILDVNDLSIKPSLDVDGIGIRLAKSSGPLLDLGVTLSSLAVHLFGKVPTAGPLSGGAQIQLSDLAVAVSGAKGGNPVAQGIMADSGRGQDKLAPKFSPALAVQKHGAGPVLVSLSAGEGGGPWWVAIQKGFGPLYVEQVAFGVTENQDQLERIALLLDGRVALFGLTAGVDDLQLSYAVASNASVFDPSHWAVDLAGLAISSDLGGIVLEGGLRKFGGGDSVEYVGMLLGRFAVYGLSVFGGYGSGVVDGHRFASFFAFGAVNGPIGGPPAFFLTGIGGGLGMNRGLVVPHDMSAFGEYPFIKALDPGAKPSGDPMAALVLLRDYFPMRRGEFWFAAGISFTSFALVDGVAVVAVVVGNELEISLLGLARMALPRPQFALVSIELGLVARFSSKEGVLWIQAQLTDNSWILHESVRLTGGFAYVSWFKGPNAGQFVLTMGGYHPHFHRDGYPDVPRLGFQWGVSRFIVIKGGSYFALTSEAVMAGGGLEASAEFGPAWAHVRFGADGIVYYDPFRFEVEVYAHISAGVTIDVWIGEITISVSMGAEILVAGPKFHGRAIFSVGPVEVTVEFGETEQSPKTGITWNEFVRKYLEEASPGVARVVTAIPGKGAIAPGTGPGGATDTGTADGSAGKPFAVFSEFEITITTTVPTGILNIGGMDASHPPSRTLGLAPMKLSAANSRLVLTLTDSNGADHLSALFQEVRDQGAFPVGVWAPPQPDDDRKVPAGDVITAVEGVRFEARAAITGTLPSEIDYHQVRAGTRLPLPLLQARLWRGDFLAHADGLSALLPSAVGTEAAFAAARPWLRRGGLSATSLVAMERERAAPPRVGSLTQGLAAAELPRAPVTLEHPGPLPTIDRRILPPRAIAVLAADTPREQPLAATRVRGAEGVARAPAPTLASVEAELPAAAAARLLRVPATAPVARDTLIAGDTVPLTRLARGGTAQVAARGGFGDARARFAALNARLAAAPERLDGELRAGPTRLRAGDIAVLQMPNADRDTDAGARRPRLVVRGGPARVVAFAHGGGVLADAAGSTNGMEVPQGTERLAVVSLGSTAPSSGLFGWHSGQELAYVGWESAVVPGAIVRVEGATVRKTRQRFRAGWVRGAEFVAGTAIVTTRFVEPVTTIAIVVDDPVGVDTARGLAFTLEGAERRLGADRHPVPPTVVTAGNRSLLLYPLVPAQIAERATPLITVGVASQDGWHLAGALGGNETVEQMADRLASHGLDAVLRPLVSGAAGAIEVDWIA